MLGGEAGVCKAVVAEVASLAVLPVSSVGLLLEGAYGRTGNTAKLLPLASDRGIRLALAGYPDWGALEQCVEGASPLRALANVRSPSARWAGTPASSP